MTVTINTEPLEVCPLCGTDDILYPSVAKEYRAEIELLNRAADLQAENERLRDAAQFAYRKHHLDDPNIGWDELSDILYTALCESMGDNEFVKWIEAAKGSK